jgi:hypothetical protein
MIMIVPLSFSFPLLFEVSRYLDRREIRKRDPALHFSFRLSASAKNQRAFPEQNRKFLPEEGECRILSVEFLMLNFD